MDTPAPITAYTSGATRDARADKPIFNGFLSHEVLRLFGAYMHAHRHQADGNLRAPDNWKKGIPRSDYLESMFRHFIDVWELHERLAEEERGNFVPKNPELYLLDCLKLEEALMALLFNVNGYTYEYLKGR